MHRSTITLLTPVLSAAIMAGLVLSVGMSVSSSTLAWP